MRSLLEEGLKRFSIPYDEEILEKLCLFMSELTRWSRRMNLTGLKDPCLIIRRLLVDSFFLFGRLEGSSAVDMGSGAGIIAVPLSLLRRGATIFSVDRTLKKIQFQRHMKRLLGLDNLIPIHGRIEEIEPLLAHLAFAKGFGSKEKALRAASRHLMEGGRLLLLKGQREKAETFPGFLLEECSDHTLSHERSLRLLVYRKL